MSWLSFLHVDEELPLFPVDMTYYHKVEDRVKLAKTIDKEEHKWAVTMATMTIAAYIVCHVHSCQVM